MAILSSLGNKKQIGIPKLKVLAEKLQKMSLLLARRSQASDFKELEQVYDQESAKSVPKDVKEGHFAVIAIENGKPKRYIVPLGFLNHPDFLRLLEVAAEEFGFDHEGALSIPCLWSDIDNILTSKFI